jgi:hypothetical protein
MTTPHPPDFNFRLALAFNAYSNHAKDKTPLCSFHLHIGEMTL